MPLVRPARPGRAALALAVVGALAASLLAALGTAAPAAASTADGIHWGIKASWRTYISTTTGDGVVTMVSPAAFEDAGGVTGAERPYRFPATAVRSGADYVITGTGGVDYWAHAGILDLKVRRPTIVTAGSSGSIVVDYVDADGARSRVTIAQIATVTIDTSTTGYVGVSGTGVTTTAAGNVMFGGFYPAGTVIDDISASAKVLASAKATLDLKKKKVKKGKRAKVRVSVAAPGSTPTGTVTVSEGSKTLATRALAAGKTELKLRKLGRGKHVLRATYSGSPTVAPATSRTRKLRVV